MAGNSNSATYLILASLICCHLLVTMAGPLSSEHGAEPYRVIRVIPADGNQFDFLVNMWQNASFYDLDFWQEPRRVASPVDIMLNSKVYPVIRQLFSEQRITYNVTIKNVKKLIIEKNQKSEISRKWSRRLNDDSSGASLNLATYNSYEDILKYIASLQRDYSHIAQVIDIGRSHEDRPLHIIKIGRSTNFAKRAIWIDAGIHAREWITITTALYFVHQLVKKYGDDPKITRYVDELDWYIMPVVNPDGYEYTRSSVEPKVRLWRKNRSAPICKQTVWGDECCQGVDLNRNFDFHWGETGASNNPCEEIYAGNRAFSEPETKAIQDFITPRQTWFYAFITLHSYSQIWMYPFGHQRNTYPTDVNDLKSVAEKATKALSSLYNTKYIVGTGADTLYPASGGSDDWAKLDMRVKFVYLLELRPEDNIWDGFILSTDQIFPTAAETWEGIKQVAEAVLNIGQPETTTVDLSSTVSSSTASSRNGECKDTEAQCSWWSSINGCTIWPDMATRCPLSCNTCGNKTLKASSKYVCFRTRGECERWKMAAGCLPSSKCRYSCKYC